ncbi:hypothetical protein Tco_0455103 [Tanacetum coccineum]
MVAEQNQRTLVGVVTAKRTFVVLIEDGGEVVVRVAAVEMVFGDAGEGAGTSGMRSPGNNDHSRMLPKVIVLLCLLDFVLSLDEDVVVYASQKAFKSLTNVSKSISELTALKGWWGEGDDVGAAGGCSGGVRRWLRRWKMMVLVLMIYGSVWRWRSIVVCRLSWPDIGGGAESLVGKRRGARNDI